MSEDYFVVLRTGQSEEFLERPALEDLLRKTVATYEKLEGEKLEQRVRNLMDTACEYPLGPSEYLEWYLTRLEKS